MADAMKLLYAAGLHPEKTRLVLVLADEEASSHFKRKSWMAQALRSHGIEVQVIDLAPDTRRAIRKAQDRQ